MFGLTHILYLVISFAVSAALIILGRRYLKTAEAHNLAVRACAIVTVLLHISPLWVDYLSEGSATVESVMLFPIHPCNVCMWLLLLITYLKRDSLAYKLLSEFLLLGGTVCGVIGLVFNENFGNNPTLADWGVFKGMLSHSTMILGTLYLGFSGLVKIRFRCTVSVTAGLLILFIDGLIINGIYALFELDPCNSMYLLEPPFENMPWLTTLVMGIAGMVVAFAITTLYERIVLKKKCKQIFTISNLLDFGIKSVETPELPVEI